MNLFEEKYGGAFDKPDPRDYSAEHILGKDDMLLPESVKMTTEANNQGSSVKCTTYAVYAVGTILNEIEHKMKLKDYPDIGWELQKKFGTWSKQGDYIQTALKSIVKNGLHTNEGVYNIEGYIRIDKKDINYWLAKKYPIYTSALVTKDNFKKAKYTGIWGGNNGPRVGGHAIALVGYKPYYVHALNSYGPKWGKFEDGTFLIKDKDLEALGHCYILHDHVDAKRIFKDVTANSWVYDAVSWAKKEGLVVGYPDGTFRPSASISRAEMIQILYNYHEKFNK
ncbi:hypothetical protein LCGC14_0918370 [marine sediment metagenome]|uniref:SLH domain-containing protein n=1 Tax=marine sediment metagenome TaxID=412755 RepID=A0A0F9NRQ4_9ZZZZ|nr:hypothetical protein [bacterium]